MLQTQKAIEQLGYTAHEAQVYIAALQIGECHVIDLARRLKLPPSSVQVIVEKLHKNGLMSFFVKNRYKYWVAEKPQRLLTQLLQREEAVRTIIPLLTSLQKKSNTSGGTSAIKVFSERDGIARIFEDMLDTKHHILGIVPKDDFFSLFEGTLLPNEFTASCARHFLRMRLLVPDTPKGHVLAETAGRYSWDVRFLPTHRNWETASFMYGDKVALIMPNRDEPTAVIIEDPGMYETHAAIFEELWSQCGGQGVA